VRPIRMEEFEVELENPLYEESISFTNPLYVEQKIDFLSKMNQMQNENSWEFDKSWEITENETYFDYNNYLYPKGFNYDRDVILYF
jgi:hypothetical protein